MATVAVVTDSSACLPPEVIEEHGIIVVPLAFLFDGELHHDGTLSSSEFYRRLRAARRFPTTTSPAPGEFLEAFRRARDGGAEAVLCLTLSSAYSGTHSSALNASKLAEQELPGLMVRVRDTHGLAMSHGFAVLAAARAVRAGAGLEAAAEAAQQVGASVHLVGALDTMRFLVKSGRVPRIVHWAASLLQIKPILAANGEDARGVGRARTMARALQEILRYVDERVRPGAPLHAAVMHADAAEQAERLEREMRERYSPVELMVSEVTSVMGIHTGPGFVGVAFYSETEVREPQAGERDVQVLAASLSGLPPPQERPALVVISGLPGSGKSHLARALVERYPLAWLQSDALRRALFGPRPSHSAAESERLFAACHVLLDKLLAGGIPVVLDATNLGELQRRPLYRIAEKQGARLVLVQVEAPPKVVEQRLEARARGDNPWDQSTAGYEVYERMRKDVEPIERAHIVVDTSGDVLPAVDEIVRELEEVRA